MPNFKIFQDNPDQVRVKIFGSNDIAFNTDASGNLSITSTGLAVTAPGGLAITSTGLAIMAPNALEITSTGLAITTTGLAVATATTSVEQTVTNISDTNGSAADSHEVSPYRTWSFGIVNSSTAANAQATVKLQISPDGNTWKDDSTVVTINQNALETLVSSIFLKYARVYYSAVNASSAVTLNIFFQGQQF